MAGSDPGRIARLRERDAPAATGQGNVRVSIKLLAASAAAVTAWGLKRHYADAGPDDLLWILSPTTWLVGIATGAAFTFQPGEGYLSREHLFLIEKSCAGINFMIAAFGMLVYALFHRIDSARMAVQVFGGSLLAGYAAAVIVNAARIAAAMWLAAHPAAWSAFSAADVHRAEGIVVYFGGLVLLYRGSDLGFQHSGTGRNVEIQDPTPIVMPLAAYFAVTLAIPVANGAAASGAFARHALVVLTVPAVLILLGCVIRRLTSATMSAWPGSPHRCRNRES